MKYGNFKQLISGEGCTAKQHSRVTVRFLYGRDCCRKDGDREAGFILATLIQNEIIRNGGNGRGSELMEMMRMLDIFMTNRVFRAILKAYGISMPEPDEDEDQEPEDFEQLNIARMIYLGTSRRGYTEAEILDMTLRKFHKIYDEYLELSGGKSKISGGIDSLL